MAAADAAGLGPKLALLIPWRFGELAVHKAPPTNNACLLFALAGIESLNFDSLHFGFHFLPPDFSL